MKITDEAKQVLEELLKQDGSDALQVAYKTSSCCGGKSLMIGMTNTKDSERTVIINGLNVAISEEDEALSKDVIIDIKDGRLILSNSESCC